MSLTFSKFLESYTNYHSFVDLLNLCKEVSDYIYNRDIDSSQFFEGFKQTPTGYAIIFNKSEKKNYYINTEKETVLDDKGDTQNIDNVYEDIETLYNTLKNDEYIINIKQMDEHMKTFKDIINEDSDVSKDNNHLFNEALDNTDDNIMRLGDSIELSTIVNYHCKILYDSVEERNNILNRLNRDFSELAYIHSSDESPLIIYADKYYIKDDILRVKVSKVAEVDIDRFPLNIELENEDDEFCFGPEDTLYKIETEKQSLRVKWYNRGEFREGYENIQHNETIKTFNALFPSVNEKFEDELKSKFSQKYLSLKKALLELLDKQLDGDITKLEDFIYNYVDPDSDEIIEGLVEDADIFDFYLKYQSDIDQILLDNKYYEDSPDVESLYDYVIDGTFDAVIYCLKDMQDELYGEE
jgi:hypothetical protein